MSTEGNEERSTEDPWAAEHVQIVREELRMVKLWKCSEQHSCTILAAKTSMTCDECGATIRRKEGYLHCFTCEPARTACYRCMRQFHGAGLPPDVQGGPCPELCDFCQDQQCHLSVGHEGRHACGNEQKCLRKARKWYPEQVGTENEQLLSLIHI